MMVPFSTEDDERLIEFVAKNPSIYNSSLSSYRDSVIRDNIWKEIAAEMKKTDKECKKRWRNIRDSYFRYKRKNKLPRGSSATQKPTKWVLYNQLLFLDKVARERFRRSSNIEADETEVTDEVDEETEETDNENSDNTTTTRTTRKTNTPSKSSLSKITPVSVSSIQSSTDAASVHTTSMRYPTRKKRKSDSAHDELIELIKKRDERRQENFNSVYQHSQASNDGPIVSFCEHIKSVLQTLPPPLLVQAKKDIYNVISKYELEATQSDVQYNGIAGYYAKIYQDDPLDFD